MINLRFHVVSLISVFLALAVGIAVGATVVDQGLLQATKANLTTVEQKVNERNEQIRQLERERDDWETMGTQGADRLVGGRLSGVPVLVVTVKGVDRDPVDALLRDLRTARADVVAQITLQPRLALRTEADLAATRTALNAASTRPETIKYLLLKRMLDAVVSPSPSSTLEPLRVAGLIESTSGVPLPELPVATRVVVVSGRNAELADDIVVVPWLAALGQSDPARVVAMEASTPPPRGPNNGDANDNVAEPEPTFVAPLRRDDEIALRLSTIDNLDSVAGRLAAVLALEDLATPVTGHYGVYDGADRLLPAASL